MIGSGVTQSMMNCIVSLRSDSLLGPFVPHGGKELTPEEWECLDGTLYVSPDGKPYLVFCHEQPYFVGIADKGGRLEVK